MDTTVRNHDKPCCKCGGVRDIIRRPPNRDPFYESYCRGCRNRHQRETRGPLWERKLLENPSTDPTVLYYNFPCTACGGERTFIHHKRGVDVYAPRCSKCATKRSGGGPQNRKHYDNEEVVSEWDLETEYIYRAVHWVTSVRPKVQTVYKRAEISALPCEKMLRILELARKGQVIII